MDKSPYIDYMNERLKKQNLDMWRKHGNKYLINISSNFDNSTSNSFSSGYSSGYSSGNSSCCAPSSGSVSICGSMGGQIGS